MFNTDDVWDITFSPDGKYLAVGFSKFEIQLWDWATKAKLKMVKGCAYTESDLLCVKTGFSPDSQFFAVRWEKTCLVYKTSDQSLYAKYHLPKGLCTAEFSPCGTKIALGSKDRVLLTEFSQNPIEKHGVAIECCTHDQYYAATFHPFWLDSNRFVGKWKKGLRVWKTPDTKML